MDDLCCQGTQVERTLEELETINRLLGGNHITLDGIRRILSKYEEIEREFEIADIGCGGGDMLIKVAKWGRSAGVKLRLTGIDANPHIVKYAGRNSQKFPEISYEVLDIFSPAFRQKQFDLVMCSLFTHHFTDEQLTELFAAVKRQSRLGVVINDLHRHWFAYWSIKVLTRYFSKSAMIKNDAPLSVKRGFLREELEKILRASGVEEYQLKWRWAFRWQLIF